MWSTFPAFGSALILVIMVMAGYTMTVSLLAGTRGDLRTLKAARLGTYATVLMIGATVLCLAYAFLSHDFRIRYVAQYSDRSMSLGYLVSALWGGQDGSLLWWLFLLSLNIATVAYALGMRLRALQPYILATLMAVVLFFCVLMVFAANPFSTTLATPKADGQGLNPLLQNFYMVIHPPSLYVGFVGVTVPFAFSVAALITGKLDHEWIVASRKWMIFAWLFLAIGNCLGMLWAYEELGWGGYWGWDPVENAALMPLIIATAYIHSVMIQERRGMLKVWNVTLIAVTFFMTIFGTFLTRSGAIASVHSFAQSSIGTYFVWFMILLVAFSVTLILYRWPELRGLPSSPRVRLAAVLTGWIVALGSAPAVALIASKVALPVATKFLIFVVWEIVLAFASIEILYRRVTKGVDMRAKRAHFESWYSREFTFLLNNWGLLGLMGFVLIATTFPMITDAVTGEKVSVGPPYFDAWVQPLALGIYFLMGAGTLFGWKKTSTQALRRAFMAPTAAFVIMAALHFSLGSRVGYPAVFPKEPIYGGFLGTFLQTVNAHVPWVTGALSAFNFVVLVQEFYFLLRARAKAGSSRTPAILWILGGFPGLLHTLVTLPAPSRRRYGGYVVHLGIVIAMLGFMGRSWTVDKETALGPGQTIKVDSYEITYVGPRTEVDTSKKMFFADVTVKKNGKDLGGLSPAKFSFNKNPEQPTSEVAMYHSVFDDLYLVVGSINFETRIAAFQIHINPLVSWIWLGFVVLILGTVVCLWPELVPGESRVWAFARSAATSITLVLITVMFLSVPARAFARQGAANLSHTGTVRIDNPEEKALFASIRCMCGSCPRELLSTCACDTADDTRSELRAKMKSGVSHEAIVEEYTKKFGTIALAVPPNTGVMRAIYALPLVGIGGGAFGLFLLMRRWRKDHDEALTEAQPPEGGKSDEYDARLDAELKKLDQ